VRPHVDHRQPLEGSEAHRGPQVVREHEVGGPERPRQPVERDPVEDARHRVLPDAEVELPAAVAAGPLGAVDVAWQEAEVGRHDGVVRLREVGRPTPQLGHHGPDGGKDGATRLARGRRAGLGRDVVEGVVEILGWLAVAESVEELRPHGVLLPPAGDGVVPGDVQLLPALGDLPGVVQDRHLVGGVRIDAKGCLHLAEPVRTHGPGVSVVRPRQLGDRVTDHGTQAHEDGPVRHRSRGGEDGGDLVQVLGVVDREDLPAVGKETPCHVLPEGDPGRSLDGDAVVVPDQRQPGEAEGTGKRGSLPGDALLQVAIGGEAPDVRAEEVRPQHVRHARRGERHPDGVGHALSQGSGGDLDAGGHVPFRVPGGPGAPDAEGTQVIDLEPVAGQVQLEVEPQAGVPAREDEPVAAHPLGLVRVVPKVALEEGVQQRREAHRGARVARSCLLHHLDRNDPRVPHDIVVLRRPSGHDTPSLPRRSPWLLGGGAAGQAAVEVPRRYRPPGERSPSSVTMLHSLPKA